MKVLLANPPAFFDDSGRHFIAAGSRWSFSLFVSKNFKEHYLPYPFSLGYSLSLLKKNTDVEAKGIDGCGRDMSHLELIDYVKSFHPDLLLMDVPTIVFPPTMKMLKEIKQETGCKIAVSGGHITALTEQVMRENDFIDYGLLAEYILNFQEIVKHERKGGPFPEELHGVAFRKNGEVKILPPVFQQFNLDDLPYPDRDDFPIEHYHDFETAGRPSAQLLSSLGCPYKCEFCMPVRVMFQNAPTYRRRKPENLVKEMAYVKEKYGAKSVYFDDDTFAVDRARLRQLCVGLNESKIDLPWAAMGDVTLDRETLTQLAKAKCVGVKFGVESANPDTLKDINKTFVDLEKVRTFVKWCRELGIWAHSTFIIGLPGDRRENIMKTIAFAKELDPDSVQFSIATPFPGTPFYEECKTKGWLITDDWTRYDGANYAVISYPWLSNKEIEDLHRVALRQWHLNAIAHEIVRPRRVIRTIKSGSVIYATRKTVSHLRGTL